MKWKLALIGAGSRGRIYADEAVESGRAEIVALAEPNAERREDARKAYNIPAERCYADGETLLRQGKLADAALICSMDRDHYAQAMSALELGYELLLEKPISPDAAECERIRAKAEQTGRRVVVCHVLRYAPFFRAVKRILDSGELGRVMTIQHNENVGNFHIAHSFVRGNWRNSTLSSPIIMQKSCHDMDLLVWFTNSAAKRVSSFGSLRYFRAENAPENSAARCLDCAAAERCRFDARKCYLPTAGHWPADVLTLDQSEAGILKALRDGPYGRCVYRCDNDVCDSMTAQIEFQNGVTASFVLSGFTNKVSRTLKIMCENGELRANQTLNVIEVTKFASNAVDEVESRVIHPAAPLSGHGGGDSALMHDFLDLLDHPERSAPSSIERSVESHVIACAIEQARVTGTVVDVDAYKRELTDGCQS